MSISFENVLPCAKLLYSTIPKTLNNWRNSQRHEIFENIKKDCSISVDLGQIDCTPIFGSYRKLEESMGSKVFQIFRRNSDGSDGSVSHIALYFMVGCIDFERNYLNNFKRLFNNSPETCLKYESL